MADKGVEKRLWRRIAAKAVDWFYPKRALCMGCGSAAGFDEHDWLCGDCVIALAKRWLGAFPDAKLDGAAAAYHYGGPAGSMVRNLKYRGVRDLAGPMAESMLRAYRAIVPTGAEVVAEVPMHARRLRRRGFNHAAALAQAVAQRLDLPWESLLVRTRDTVQQARLVGTERRGNPRGAITADPERVRGRRVLLVDDVYTTGETAHACAKALRSAGAKSVTLLVYAKGGR